MVVSSAGIVHFEHCLQIMARPKQANVVADSSAVINLHELAISQFHFRSHASQTVASLKWMIRAGAAGSLKQRLRVRSESSIVLPFHAKFGTISFKNASRFAVFFGFF